MKFNDFKKGDVVVFRYPKDEEKDFIKRIIGVAGDAILVKDGDVYVNGQKLDQHAYLKSDVKTYGGSFLGEAQTITIPKDQYFVMGDNRPYSSDSREWGFVKKEEIIGRSLLVYWPLDKMRVVTNPY